MPSPKVRLRFAKRGDLRLVSHHDLMRCLERMARRAELPLAQSQGFNPRPKIAFTLALALGIEGHHEVVEMELAEPMEPAEVLRRLAAVSPPGLEWLDAEDPGPGRPAQAEAVRYALPVPADRRDAARAALADFLARDRWPYTRHRPDRTVEIDLRPFLLEADLETRRDPPIPPEDVPERLRPARRGDRRPRPARPPGTGGRPGSHRSGAGPLIEQSGPPSTPRLASARRLAAGRPGPRPAPSGAR